MHPPCSEGLFQLVLRRTRLVVGQRRVRDAGDDVLETEDARPGHLSVDRVLNREGPRHRQLHVPRADARLFLCGEDAIQCRQRGLDVTPRSRRLALGGVVEEVGLVEQYEHRDRGMPLGAPLEAVLEAVQRGPLPSVVAIILRALPGVVGVLGVVARQDAEAHGAGVVQERAVVLFDLEAEGVVQADGVGAQLPHRAEVVAPARTPLGGVARLQHVFRGEALAAAGVRRARQRAVRDALERRPPVTARGRHRNGGRRRPRLSGRGGSGGRDGCVWRLHAHLRGIGASSRRARQSDAAPSGRHCRGPSAAGAQQPRQGGVEATHGPCRARGCVVANLSGLADLLAQAEEAEVHLGAALLVGGLELEQDRSHEGRRGAVGCLRHRL
mmetsp:Transcript_55431/g.155556  ORF Transcript_55431/g.155556 Transcript_55431/m.155556 type:complete len:384 (+) Transcript_55431:688-1839(+)